MAGIGLAWLTKATECNAPVAIIKIFLYFLVVKILLNNTKGRQAGPLPPAYVSWLLKNSSQPASKYFYILIL